MGKVNGRVAGLRENAKILQDILGELVLAARPGVSTWHLNMLAERLIRRFGAAPAFPGGTVRGKSYQFAICASLGNAVVHSPPSRDTILQPGDVLSLDVGLVRNFLFADLATTIIVGGVPRRAEDKALVDCALVALRDGIGQAVAGNRVGAISYAIQMCVNAEGFSVVGNLAGHGIGRRLHEPPVIRSYGYWYNGPILREGMVLCIEPAVADGDKPIVYAETQDDGWTEFVPEATIAAHFEAMVLVGRDSPEVLGLVAPGV